MTIETTPDEDFANAFSSFAEPGKEGADGTTAEPAAAEPAAEPATDAGAAEPAAGAEAESEPAAAEPAAETGAEPAAAEAAAEPAAAVAEPPAKTDDVDTDAVLKRLAEAIKAQPAAEAPAAAEPAPAEQAIFSPEEQQVLDAYEAEWGDVSRAEALKRRAEYRELMGYMFQEVAKQFIPIKEMAEALAERTHLSDVKTAVPDYSDDLRTNVLSWVEQQPVYLQAAYNQVIQQGTSEEVADLITRYRKETGTGAPAPAPSKKDTELSEPAKQAAAALAPVSTKRSVTPAQDDMSNFDAAFASFAKDAEKV